MRPQMAQVGDQRPSDRDPSALMVHRLPPPVHLHVIWQHSPMLREQELRKGSSGKG